MNNFAVIEIAYAHWPAGILIRILTNNPCHLTCYHTDKTPLKHPLSRTIRGLTVPWGVYYCFVAYTAVEQTEPGDTLYHTFKITPWVECQTRWFTFQGTVGAVMSPSTGPIFKHHHPGAILDTLILRPNAPGDIEQYLAQYPANGPTDHWNKVDDITPDEAATYVYAYNSNIDAYWDLYNIPNHTTEFGLIAFVEVTLRCQRQGASGRVKAYLKISGTKYRASPYQNVALNWTNYSFEWDTNPNTGIAWTWANIDALQVGLSLGTAAFKLCRCTQVYLEVKHWR